MIQCTQARQYSVMDCYFKCEFDPRFSFMVLLINPSRKIIPRFLKSPKMTQLLLYLLRFYRTIQRNSVADVRRDKPIWREDNRVIKKTGSLFPQTQIKKNRPRVSEEFWEHMKATCPFKQEISSLKKKTLKKNNYVFESMQPSYLIFVKV